MTKQETIKETKKHIQIVSYFLSKILDSVGSRMVYHDESKLEDFEIDIFVEYTPKLKTCTYGSDEYKSYLKEMKPALDHHYANNRHHPEHFRNGIKDMDLVDIVEMICDWKAATLRHNDGDIMKSLEINQARFGYSDELKQILKNTVTNYMKELD